MQADCLVDGAGLLASKETYVFGGGISLRA
jgi:hypothetical protein